MNIEGYKAIIKPFLSKKDIIIPSVFHRQRNALRLNMEQTRKRQRRQGYCMTL